MINPCSNLIGLFILVLFSVNLIAQDKTPIKDPLALISKLKKQAKKTSSIIAPFSQKKYVSFMDKPQLSSGIFYYEQPNKIRWEQNKPFNYVLLINGEKIRIKDNGKEKNIKGVNKMMGKINTLMLGLVNGKIFNNKAFITKCFSSKNLYIIDFEPVNKQLKLFFSKIELSFSKENSRLKELTFFENSGDKSVMKFFNEKINQAINASLFLKL